MADTEIILDFGALSTLARAWGSNHDDIHGRALSALVAALDLTEKVIEVDVAKIHSFDRVY